MYSFRLTLKEYAFIQVGIDQQSFVDVDCLGPCQFELFPIFNLQAQKWIMPFALSFLII